MARPTKYTKEMGEEICELLMGGKSLNSICRMDKFPHRSNVLKWLASDNPIYYKFQDHYDRAREIQYQTMMDDLLDIADDGSNDWMLQEAEDDKAAVYRVNGENIARSRLRVDTRKWFMSKVLPKFKDKPEDENKNKDQSITINLVDAKKPDGN